MGAYLDSIQQPRRNDVLDFLLAASAATPVLPSPYTCRKNEMPQTHPLGIVASTDPKTIRINQKIASEQFSTFGHAASRWFSFGFKCLPLLPGEKKPAVKWDPWLEGLSKEKITGHWAQHPRHEVAFIVCDDVVVFDADSQQAIKALVAIERSFGTAPNLVVKTNRGEHHYFRLAAGTYAKSDSHDTLTNPDRIDVKTGRAMVNLPPSNEKSIVTGDLSHSGELVEVGQGLIDAVFNHNGRSAPRAPSPQVSTQTQEEPTDHKIRQLRLLLDHIDPDCGYDDWLRVLIAVHHETCASDVGYKLADEWSSKGSKYRGSQELASKWSSFNAEPGTPVTIATLINMITRNGFDVREILETAEPLFERCETIIIDSQAGLQLEQNNNPFDKYSLRGKSGEIERLAVSNKPILGKIALQGQATVIFAAPNSGKTLTTLALLVEAIRGGRLNPETLYYLNMDDSSQGLLEKNRIATEYGFHMLSEGYRDFEASAFVANMNKLVADDQAKDVVIVLDTLKKFADQMDKRASAEFNKRIRAFVLKGGTVIALAHVNKNKGSDGRPIPAGTSDISDDFDCAYTLTAISTENEWIARFNNIKRRGNVVGEVAYSFCNKSEIAYDELLLSVELIDDTKVHELARREETKSDTEVIDVIGSCIAAGINSKMKLAAEVAQRSNISKRLASQLLEKYTGTDPLQHKWTVRTGERGAKLFTLLKSP